MNVLLSELLFVMAKARVVSGLVTIQRENPSFLGDVIVTFIEFFASSAPCLMVDAPVTLNND